MPVSGPLLRRLMAAGVTGDDLVEVVEMIDAEMATAAAAMPTAEPRSSSATRQARYRARLRGEVTESDVTSYGDSDVTVTSLSEKSPPKIKLNPPETSLRSESHRARAALFADFWVAFPKRQGSNPKQPAEEKFYRLLKTSDHPDRLASEITAGARLYAASVVETDPKYIAQANTWLNQSRWKDDYSEPMRRGSGQRAPPSRSPPTNNRRAAIDEILSLAHDIAPR